MYISEVEGIPLLMLTSHKINNYFQVFCETGRGKKSLSRECIASNMAITKPHVDTAISIHCSRLGTAPYQTAFSLLEECATSLFESKGKGWKFLQQTAIFMILMQCDTHETLR